MFPYLFSQFGHKQRVSNNDNVIETRSDTPAFVYNLTAPNPVSNHTFTKTLGSWLHRPTLFTLPEFLLKLMFGEMSTLLIDGQKEGLESSGMAENQVLLDAFGINDWQSVWTMEGVITGYIMNLFLPLLVAIAVIGLVNKIGAKAEEDGTFEFVASLPFTRTMIITAHSIVLILLGLIIPLVWIHFIYIPTLFMDINLNYGSLLASLLQSSLGGITFAAIALGIGAATGKASLGWAAGIGLLAFEWISGMLAGNNEFFEFIRDWFSSFGAYNNPYINGLDAGNLLLVIIKTIIFLMIGFWGFRNRSLNLK